MFGSSGAQSEEEECFVNRVPVKKFGRNNGEFTSNGRRAKESGVLRVSL